MSRTGDGREEIPPGTLELLILRALAREGQTQERRRARYYQLTPAGERQLDVELGRFERVMGAVFRALGTA